MPWLDLEDEIAEEFAGLIKDPQSGTVSSSDMAHARLGYWANAGLTLLKNARVGMSRRKCESAPSKYASRVARGLCPCGAARDSEKLRCSRCREKRRTAREPKLGVTYRLTAAGNPAPIRSCANTKRSLGRCIEPSSRRQCIVPGIQEQKHRERNALRWKARWSSPHGTCPKCGRPSAPPRDGVRGVIRRKQCVACLANDRARRHTRQAGRGAR